MLSGSRDLDSTDKRWHEIHAKKLIKRKESHSERLARRRAEIGEDNRRRAMRFHIKVPQTLNLVTNFEQTIDFINLIKSKVLNDGVFVLLDFSDCTEISTETCVLLAAEVHRLRSIREGSVSGSYPQNANVYLMLNELGFFTLIGVRSSPPIFDNLPDVDVVKLSSGMKNPVQLIRGMKELFYSSDGDRPNTPYSSKIYRAITEAMINAQEHAYRPEFREQNPKTCLPYWWRAGFKMNNNNTVTMVLCDQGAGMAKTMSRTWPEKLSDFATKFSRNANDAERIELAMEKGRSRTKKPGRGQGSYDMQSLIRASSKGFLMIFSNSGKYCYENDGTFRTESLPRSIDGTLIVWQICLNTVGDEFYE